MSDIERENNGLIRKEDGLKDVSPIIDAYEKVIFDNKMNGNEIVKLIAVISSSILVLTLDALGNLEEDNEKVRDYFFQIFSLHYAEMLKRAETQSS